MKILVLLPVLFSSCLYAGQPFEAATAFPKETLEGHCPPIEDNDVAEFTINNPFIQMDFPQGESWIGNPSSAFHVIGPMQQIDFYLGAETSSSSQGMTWFRFFDGVKDALIDSPEAAIYFNKNNPEDSIFDAGGCSGPSEFNWTFDRMADRAIITKKFVENKKVFHFLVFWKRDQSSSEDLFDYSADGEFELVD